MSLSKALFRIGLVIFVGNVVQGVASLFIWPAISPLSVIDTQLAVVVVSMAVSLLLMFGCKLLFPALFFLGCTARAGGNVLGLLAGFSVMTVPGQIFGVVGSVCGMLLVIALGVILSRNSSGISQN